MSNFICTPNTDSRTNPSVKPPKVRISGNTVVKHIEGQLLEAVTKYRAIHSISLIAAFRAPRVIEVDKYSSCIILEKLDNLVSSRSPYIDYMRGKYRFPDIMAIVKGAAEALANIHTNLQGPTNNEWVPTSYFTKRFVQFGVSSDSIRTAQRVQLHCDYGFSNVCVLGPDCETIAIIDPCADGYTVHTDWCVGPYFMDVGKFLLSLEGLLPPSQQLYIRNDIVAKLQFTFVNAYAVHCNYKVDIGECLAASYAIGGQYFRSAYPKSYPVALSVLFNNIRDNRRINEKMKRIQRIV